MACVFLETIRNPRPKQGIITCYRSQVFRFCDLSFKRDIFLPHIVLAKPISFPPHNQTLVKKEGYELGLIRDQMWLVTARGSPAVSGPCLEQSKKIFYGRCVGVTSPSSSPWGVGPIREQSGGLSVSLHPLELGSLGHLHFLALGLEQNPPLYGSVFPLTVGSHSS